VNICLDENIDASNTIKLNLFVLVVAPVTHPSHVGAAGVVLLVTCNLTVRTDIQI